ncbi:Rossmann-like domain-containing protein [Solidesulfovibrio sp.]
MRRRMSQAEILRALVNEVQSRADQPIVSVTTGTCLTAVFSQRLGLASLVSHIAPGQSPPSPTAHTPAGVHEAADQLLDAATGNTDAASLAMAAVNSLLPSPAKAAQASGQDILLARGRGRRVAVVGHFPFVEKMREAFADFRVLEKRPRPGDTPADQAGAVLPRADVVALTGTTLLNGSLAGLLALCRPDALVIMLGPTTPFAESLFACGIDVLAGCDVPDPQAALASIRAGHCFKGLSGVRQTTWVRPDLDEPVLQPQ